MNKFQALYLLECLLKFHSDIPRSHAGNAISLLESCTGISYHPDHHFVDKIVHASDIEIAVSFDQEFLDIRALFHGHPVGYAYCQRLGKRLVILDIKIVESLPLTWTRLHKMLTLLVIYRRMRLRGRGIGSRILGRVLTEAEAIGAAEVWGSVVPSDIDRSPLLLQWYERHGFVITNPDHVCIPAAVKKISGQIESHRSPETARKYPSQ